MRPIRRSGASAMGAHLSADQEAAAAALRAEIAAGGYSATLVYGVTGSGKTEVYLEAVAECIAGGGQALVLLPEVALTAGFLDRVEARFGARPGRVAPRRHRQRAPAPVARRGGWRGAAGGRRALGAVPAVQRPAAWSSSTRSTRRASSRRRSSTTTPATWPCCAPQIEGATAVLASATPSLETWANARAGKYRRLDLPERFGAAVLPEIRLVDLRAEQSGARPLDLRAAGRGDAGAAGAGRAVAVLPQPAGLRAADALPGLRAPLRLPRLRRLDGDAPLPGRAALPPVRAHRAAAEDLPRPAGATTGWRSSAPASSGWPRRRRRCSRGRGSRCCPRT